MTTFSIPFSPIALAARCALSTSITFIPAKEVETIDTTGAGDVFCGAFSVYLSQGHSLAESVKFANAAAAIAVTRIGAQSAIPYKREVNL